MLHIALLWHMHQPYYVNPLTKTAMMPWVRLHAVKGYLDMAEMARRHPEMRAVFNLTPVLIRQVVELVNGEVKDLWEEWSRIPAADLSPQDKRNLLEHFFKANWDNLIRPNPRYHELLARRGYDLSHISLDAIVPSFSKQDYLDLQVWFNLAWCGYAACAGFSELRKLKAKGRHFSEDDKQTVLAAHGRILRDILPRYRVLAETGGVELSTTPYFHPISPLILDSEFAHRAMPMAALPPRFHWPEDIEAQLRLAVEQHQRVMGERPVGLWPSEGSVCPELIPIWQKLGFQWFATDEDILFRSLARESGQPIERVQLYDACEAEWDGAAVQAIFRDRSLSDFIGFSAAKNSAQDAAAFIMRHIHGIVSATASKTDPLVAIVLDGENAWEYFPDGGEGFLDRWYRELTQPNGWRMTTLRDYVKRPVSRRRLRQLHSGSWIQGNFDIWIGDPEENRAWQLLGETRQWWERRRGGVSAEIAERVWMEIYAAEGSDWFWWYGPDFQTDNDLLFDELFRTHLQNVYRLCDAPPPESLSQHICRPSAVSAKNQAPIGLIHPVLDGIQTTFFEWHEGGRYDAGQSRGAMYQGERILRTIHYGFDMEHFYLRLDSFPDVAKHADLQVSVHLDEREPLTYLWAPATGSIRPGDERTSGRSLAAYRKIVEISATFAALGLKKGDTVRFQVSVEKNAGETISGATELERHPPADRLEFIVPDELFAASIWSA
ncbi:MAG: alpha-amylase [Verrucomicrobia bacterium]|nr:alpha-amylase [Verrucomicrobiota bacterium]